MNNGLNILKAMLLLFASSVAFADSNLQVSVVNTDPTSGSQCVQGPLPTSSTFNVVIKNINTQSAVTIQNVVFNNHNATEGTTGIADIVGNSDNVLEQKYLLQSCNGKQLDPNQTCTIPMVFNYGTTPITTSTTLTIGAGTGVDPSNYSTASFTVGNGMQNQGLSIAVYNISGGPYYSQQFKEGAFMPSGSYEELVYGGAPYTWPPTAYFDYTITNNSNVAKTIVTRCAYIPQYASPAGSVINNGVCDGKQLLPGQSCTAVLALNPSVLGAGCTGQDGCYGKATTLLSVRDTSSVVALMPENINNQTIEFYFWGTGK